MPHELIYFEFTLPVLHRLSTAGVWNSNGFAHHVRHYLFVLNAHCYESPLRCKQYKNVQSRLYQINWYTYVYNRFLKRPFLTSFLKDHFQHCWMCWKLYIKHTTNNITSSVSNVACNVSVTFYPLYPLRSVHTTPQLHCVTTLHLHAKKLQCTALWCRRKAKFIILTWNPVKLCGALQQKVMDISVLQRNCGVV